MIVLGVETATATCGVAVVDGDRVVCEFRERAPLAHAEHLLGLIDRALSDSGTGIVQLGGVALSIGPGVFTGLRIGAATVKGLLAGTPVPVACVSTLEALAWNGSGSPNPVCPMLEAGRGQVYAGLFEFPASGEIKRLMEDRLLSPEVLPDEFPREALFLGGGATRLGPQIRRRFGPGARFAPPAMNEPAASVVARLGMKRFLRGEGTAAGKVSPVYLRRTDAEVLLERKNSAVGGKTRGGIQ